MLGDGRGGSEEAGLGVAGSPSWTCKQRLGGLVGLVKNVAGGEWLHCRFRLCKTT